MNYLNPLDHTDKYCLEVRTKSRKAMEHAIEIMGTKTKLARALNVSPEVIYSWMNINRYGISPRHALLLEELTQGRVTRYQLRADIYQED